MIAAPASLPNETRQQKFERVLSFETFDGLKAILGSLARSREALCDAVHATSSYGDLIARLGYGIQLTRQIHVQDSYSHVGPAGGIKTVLPYHDIPTHSSHPTLIHFDSTLTTTPRTAAFFTEILGRLKKQLGTE